MNNMKQWQQDISNVVDKNSLDIKNLQDNSDVGKLTVRIDNIEAKDREQDVQLSNHGEQLENLFNKINTDVGDTKTEINNTIEQLRLNTNNSITALQTSTDRALDTIKQNTTDSLNSLKTSIDRNIELLKSNTADSITALQTSIDRHTEELDNLDEKIIAVDSRLDDRGIPTGTVLHFAGATVPDGYLPCNGASVSRETYADLFAVIGTTFGSGDGSTTFDLPNLIDKFAQGSATVGTVKSAGLPNITGKIDEVWLSTEVYTGCFSESSLGVTHKGQYSDNTTLNLTFNASKSNAIYGNSDTVQPPALTLLPCIKY